jgi:uncharacterized membrane protein
MALPDDAEIQVILSDISLQDVAARVIAETKISPAGRQVPIPFELRFNPAGIDSKRTYAVRATIRSAGQLLFTTDTVQQVLTRGHPATVELWLVRAHGTDTGLSTPSPATFRAPASRAGKLVLRANELRFIPCGETGEGTPVMDRPDGAASALVRELGGGVNGITVLVALEGNRIQEIRYAGLEGPGCEKLPPEGTIEARGNEPFWQMRVEGTDGWIRTPQTPDGIRYRDGRWSQPSPKVWQFEAQRDLPEQVEKVTLEITETQCTDGMSGARYPYRAALTRGIERWEGCALEGRQSIATP